MGVEEKESTNGVISETINLSVSQLKRINDLVMGFFTAAVLAHLADSPYKETCKNTFSCVSKEQQQ